MDAWLQPLIDWLNGLPLQAAIRETSWALPLIQTVHILAVAIVLTASLIIALRGIGLVGRDWSLARWQARFGTSAALALWTLLGTGLLMILAEPERELLNWLFRAKMLLVIVTLILAHALARALRATRTDRQAGPGVRLLAVVVFAAWIAVAMAGRWIAYVG
ncbi:conserved hypothetical membrane protein [Sphingobium sp. SYK-6]|uniref:DUF6644 family protein n=1 Tax=Sphingobium sp. (strain NBRC 103272 / SYK-6) TaxID=627192 RepID=UPI0002276E1F|nr:DUF6644 family protein [Sphingobium sp. SYK-6]BAK65659.1 conserved hypothetical membrane protein [Sphingobium sp. SYK-6]